MLTAEQWLPVATAHEQRVDAWVGPHLERRRLRRKHPVEDFLFDYYHHSPAKLRRWHPGAGVTLAGPEAVERYGGLAAYLPTPDGGVTADLDRLEARTARLRDVRRLLVATASRPPAYGCFGLHEWAMVYRTAEVRHPAWPLRLGTAGTDAVVESMPLRCTHVDAFRFFTPDAVPRNATTPTRATQPRDEQPGCLHAGMDLYKWASTADPFLPSELVADCFAHAREVRVVDMRASPYDLRGLGYRPIAVETPEGRAEYVRAQRGFAERGAGLRDRLVAALDRLLALAPGPTAPERRRPAPRGSRPSGTCGVSG